MHRKLSLLGLEVVKETTWSLMVKDRAGKFGLYYKEFKHLTDIEYSDYRVLKHFVIFDTLSGLQPVVYCDGSITKQTLSEPFDIHISSITGYDSTMIGFKLKDTFRDLALLSRYGKLFNIREPSKTSCTILPDDKVFMSIVEDEYWSRQITMDINFSIISSNKCQRGV